MGRGGITVSRKRLTHEERAAIVSAIDSARDQGRPLRDLIEEHGISQVSYYKWRRDLEPAAFRSVTVAAPAPATAAPTLVSPAGYRVEGLDLAELAQLLRYLG